MTREGIIRMARTACDTDKVDAWHNGFWTLTQEKLERFAELIILECAKVVSVGVALREPASTYVSKILELRNERTNP